ncbi:Long-chain-alcohol oxidase [Arachis hypogaea]|nr:Long-chain-alcohol oxidase [Arachis hypogaea]
MEDEKNSNTLLKRGNRREKGYNHGLSSSRIQVMAFFCEVLLPSLPLNKEQNHALSVFYNVSSSQASFPDEVNFACAVFLYDHHKLSQFDSIIVLESSMLVCYN